MKNHIIISLLFLSVGLSQQIIHTEIYDSENIKSITYHKKTRDKIEIVKFFKYYESGQKKLERTYKDGKLFNILGRWNKDGSVRKEPFIWE